MVFLPGFTPGGQLEVHEEHDYRACNEALKKGWDLYAVIPARHNHHSVVTYILVRYNKIDNSADTNIYNVIEP